MITEAIATKQQDLVEKAYQAFFSPAQYEVKAIEQAVLARGQTDRLPFASGEVAITTWGKHGPAILLMHGWGGARAQMTGFVDPLLAAGYRVVAYDQPAHGESTGKMTNLLEIAPTLDLILRRYGKFEGIIAHSFGTLITTYALVKRNFLPPARLIYFGAFNRLLDSLPRFQVLTGLPAEIIAGLRHMMYENLGQEILEVIVNERLAPRMDIPTLMFHDTADRVTPIEDSRAIAKNWPSAQLIETTGLGHRGALHSKEIHQQVIRFLTGN